MIKGIIINKLKIIPDERGEIMHMIKKSDENFSKFGEIYFATAYPGVVKGWHLHKTQEQNYCVIKGMIKLVIYDPREDSPTFKEVQEIFLGEKNYSIVKIPPGLVNGWKCIGTEKAILANCSNEEHRKDEMERIDPSSKSIPYNWDIVIK
mgnify:FL=1|tara:strand:+ start:2049 stop:2498 length:450 start_codon:yes stop_codon:yes gene_type:complete